MLKNSIMCSSNNVFLDDFNWPINDFEYLEVIEEKIRDTLRYAWLFGMQIISLNFFIHKNKQWNIYFG